MSGADAEAKAPASDLEVAKVIIDRFADWGVEGRILWATKVGSHMWKTNHGGSDEDTMLAYLAPTTAILRGTVRAGDRDFSPAHPERHGKADARSIPKAHLDGPEVDIQIHELGAWVDMVLKGNVNYLWATHSPIALITAVVDSQRRYFDEFRALARAGMATNAYDSIHGLAESNMRKYLGPASTLTPQQQLKRKGMIARTLRFGIAWMDGRIEFPTLHPGEYDLEAIVKELDEAKAASKLPAWPANEGEMRDFMLGIRRADLEGKL